MIRAGVAALLAALLLVQLGVPESRSRGASTGPELVESASDEALALGGVPPGLGVPAAQVRELRREAIRRARVRGESAYEYTVRTEGGVRPSIGR